MDGLAQMAGQTALEVYNFCSAIRDAPREITAISNDVNALKPLILNLEGALGSDAVRNVVDEDPEVSNALWTLAAPIKNCQSALRLVKDKTSPYLKKVGSAQSPDSVGKSDDPQIQRPRFSRTYVLWHFKRKEIFGLLAELERAKSTFSDAMGSITLLLTLKLHPQANGTRVLQEGYEFNADLGSVLNDYAVSVVGLRLDDNQSQTSETTTTATAPPARSDHDAAEELKTVVSSGSIFLLKAALQYIQVDSRDQKGRTALSYAAEWGKYDVAKALLDEGASVSAKGWSLSGRSDGHDPFFYSGATPLWWAANRRRTDVADLLLRHGANPNSRTTSGRTAFQESCWWGDVDTARCLILSLRLLESIPGSGLVANAWILPKQGWAPIHEAVTNEQMGALELLVSHGALLDIATMQPESKTALHFAVERQRIDMVELLLKSGANPQYLMIEDVTPLHLAAAGGWILGIEMLAKSWDVPLDPRDTLLLETPLHKAARNRHVEAIDRLSALGANRKARNVDGQTCEELLACSLANPGQWDVPKHLATWMESGYG
ncbi:hypothetical protein APSETT445_007099 [Aspergillus pseudonomiae]